MIAADALVCGIETSCDETAVAVVRGGREILSNVIASQIDLHAPYGGVVPELAARAHVERLPLVLDAALHEAGISARDINAVAATRGPGLIGALLVGYAAGKALSTSLGVPFYGAHHIEGHILASLLGDDPVEPPFVALVVSGGHTSLFGVRAIGDYEVIGRTVDDAAGEAFDKIARFLGLGYPGGPVIDAIAREGDPAAIDFPRAMRGNLDFSFSGLKTAVVRHVRRARAAGEEPPTADIAASFQQAVVDVLVDKTLRAAADRGLSTVVLGGGVAANSQLRDQMAEQAGAAGMRLVVPARELCVDNAAMIAAAGHVHLARGETTPLQTPAKANLPLVA